MATQIQAKTQSALRDACHEAAHYLQTCADGASIYSPDARPMQELRDAHRLARLTCSHTSEALGAVGEILA